MTQIDTRCFGKFKALTNYSKVGKHTHIKHLFVGAWNLSGGLSCLKTSILTMLQSSPLGVSALCQAALPKFYHLAPPPTHTHLLSQTQTNSALQSSRALCYFH